MILSFLYMLTTDIIMGQLTYTASSWGIPILFAMSGGTMRDFISDYLAIGIGLMIGSAAHLGRMLTEGKVPSWFQLVGYLMQLGLIGLVASVVTKEVGMTDPDFRAMTAATLALSAHEVIQFLKRKAREPLLRALINILDVPPRDDD